MTTKDLIEFYRSKHHHEIDCEEKCKHLHEQWRLYSTLPKSQSKPLIESLFRQYPEMVEFFSDYFSKNAPPEHWIWSLDTYVDRKVSENEEEVACIICTINVRRTVFKPCSHCKLCVGCTKKYINDQIRNDRNALPRCPECRRSIEVAEVVII